MSLPPYYLQQLQQQTQLPQQAQLEQQAQQLFIKYRNDPSIFHKLSPYEQSLIRIVHQQQQLMIQQELIKQQYLKNMQFGYMIAYLSNLQQSCQLQPYLQQVEAPIPSATEPIPSATSSSILAVSEEQDQEEKKRQYKILAYQKEVELLLKNHKIPKTPYDLMIELIKVKNIPFVKSASISTNELTSYPIKIFFKLPLIDQAKQKCSIELSQKLLNPTQKFVKITNDFTLKKRFNKKTSESDTHNAQTFTNLTNFFPSDYLHNKNNLFIDGMNIIYRLIALLDSKFKSIPQFMILINFIDKINNSTYNYDNYIIFLHYHIIEEYFNDDDIFLKKKINNNSSNRENMICYEYKKTETSKPYYFICLPQKTPENANNHTACPKSLKGYKINEADDYLLVYFWLKFGGFILSYDNYEWFEGSLINIGDKQYFLNNEALNSFKIHPNDLFNQKYEYYLDLLKVEIRGLYTIQNKKELCSASQAGGYQKIKHTKKNKKNNYTRNTKKIKNN